MTPPSQLSLQQLVFAFVQLLQKSKLAVQHRG
jgi:hypothetical protein